MANWYIAMNNLGVGKGKHSLVLAHRGKLRFSVVAEAGYVFKQLTFDVIHYRIAI